MEIDVDYPDRAAERKILFETTGAEETRAKPAMTAEDLMAAQRLVRRLPVGESVVEAILALVRSARPGPKAAKPPSSSPGDRRHAPASLSCWRYARGHCSTAARARRSTT